MKQIAAVGSLAVLTLGCASQSGARMVESGMCADLLTVNGETWTGFKLSERLHRPLVGAPRTGRFEGCDDGGAADAHTVTLRRIRGISPHDALLRVGLGYEDVIYVRGVSDTAKLEDLPRKVQHLITKG